MIHGWEHKKIMDVLMTGEYYGNLVLDVGANQAGFTYLGALNGRRVVTFEALQPNIDFIKERLKENYVGPRVKLVHGAVWDTSGLTKYFLDQPEVDFNGQMKPVQNTEGMRPVQTVTIDDHVDEDVQVLKLDVEGCELNALWGAKKLLTTRRVPFIVLEYSPLNIGMVTEGKDPNLVMQFLSDLGYSVYLHVCHRCDRTDLRWPCEHSNLGALPQALLSHDSENSAYAKARRILPSEFREFTQWMYDYVEKPSPQVDLMFFRGRDLPRNVQQH